MVTVSIVGLIAAISVPALSKSRSATQVTRVMKALRTFEEAFQLYSLERGGYPVDCELDAANHLPPGSGMESYLRVNQWTNRTSLGGNYNWEGPSEHGYAGIAIFGGGVRSNDMREIDERLDDADVATGKFRIIDARYTYVIEENAPSL